MEKLRIGLVGTSQLSFPGNKEAAFAACAKAMEKHAEDMGFELLVYPETVIVREDAVKAVKAMEEAKIDFLMVQHTSYSAGQLAPVLAKIKDANVGFWAIPEGEAIEGAVPFNSLCSINMHMGIVAHYLKDYKIKVKWFYGYGEDKEFTRRLQITVRALTAIKNLKKARIGLVGGVAPGLTIFMMMKEISTDVSRASILIDFTNMMNLKQKLWLIQWTRSERLWIKWKPAPADIPMMLQRKLLR